MFKFVKIAFSTPTPFFNVVIPRAVLINVQVEAVVPSARHLCCNVDHINAL